VEITRPSRFTIARGGARCGTIGATNIPEESGSQPQKTPMSVNSRVGAPSIVNSWIASKIEPLEGRVRATIHFPSGDTVARPGTDEITRYATGRVVAVGVLLTAMVGAAVALDMTETVGDAVGAGAATHAGAQTNTASART